ncbi:MAG: S-adenosyl-l-methionine hydroxide adenosyltransferase family protein [Flavobacteriales bacterium]
MAVITLTTDLGLKDYYVGSLKGAILKEIPNATIVDISHDIPPFDIAVASFCLKNVYTDFPQGSIHIIGVAPNADEQTRHLVMEKNGHYFIGADNGIFSLLFDTPAENIHEIQLSDAKSSLTFPTKDVFVKAAAIIARGEGLEKIGRKAGNIQERMIFRAISEGNIIKGMVTYIDTYGNVITNISKQLFSEFGKGRNFGIIFRRADYTIDEISDSYNLVPEGEKLALFSDSDFLEISINKGNASNLFGLKLYDTIRIEFEA